MLLATVNCSIGNKANHLDAKTVLPLLQGKEPSTALERYALDIINTEATQEEIEAFMRKMNHAELLHRTKEIIAEKEIAYELLGEKHLVDEIDDKDAFILSYSDAIKAYESRVREHNYTYTCRLILNHYEQGFYYDNKQIETLFMLIDGQRLGNA